MSLTLQGIQVPLAEFTLEVDVCLRGRATALFGPSGAGKTTLLEVIAGLRRPKAGRVALGDRVLCDCAQRLHLKPQERRMGYVPQDGALFPHLSVRGNLDYARGAVVDAARQARFRKVSEVLELESLLERSIDAISGGEQRRVALGRALLASPQFLLLDEPLAGLDTALKERLMQHLRYVRDEFGIPMLFVTHSADEVVDLCDDALLLQRGNVTAHAAPSELFVPSERPRYRLAKP